MCENVKPSRLWVGVITVLDKVQMLLKSSILVLGYWYGIELEKPHGKNDGSVGGVQYFSCSPRYGIFAPPSRVQR